MMKGSRFRQQPRWHGAARHTGLQLQGQGGVPHLKFSKGSNNAVQEIDVEDVF